MAPHPGAVSRSAWPRGGEGAGTEAYARGSAFCYGICALYLPISGCAPVWRLPVVNSPNWKAQSASAGNPPESASRIRLSFLWFNLNQPLTPDIRFKSGPATNGTFTSSDVGAFGAHALEDRGGLAIELGMHRLPGRITTWSMRPSEAASMSMRQRILRTRFVGRSTSHERHSAMG